MRLSSIPITERERLQNSVDAFPRRKQQLAGWRSPRKEAPWVSAAVRRGPPACEHFVNEITNLVGNLILSSVNNSQTLRTPHLTFCEQVYLWIILYK